ncbi:MAG TPA: hypothetical protein VFD84_13295 [Candidatus Binatia bacterium]|jgi:hypothetical protein|nr:hypothetical protein [Candidatus Binatia bacterium]
MAFGAAEALLLAGLVILLFRIATPIRRRLERWFARRLGRSAPRQSTVVVLERRRDGAFGRGGEHGE